MSACLLVLFAFSLLMLFPRASAADSLKISEPNCTCSVEKGSNGQETFTLIGTGCEKVAEKVKKEAKPPSKTAGSNCQGMCSCTWYDNLGKRGGFICRGCCREILAPK